MAERNPQLDERVQELEREIQRLYARVDRGAADREAITKLPRNPRLAKTCAETAEGTYPDLSDVPNTYWIKFLDSTFTLAEGDQTPTHTARQADGSTLAHVIDGTQDFLPEDTVVIVTFDNGRWWIIRTFSGDLWAKAVSNVSDPETDGDWEENSGDPRVYCKVCDRDGNNVTGDGFWIYLPRLRGAATDLDPSVYVDDVIRWSIDDEGTPVCESPYLWSSIGDLRWIKDAAKIQTGWQECDGTGTPTAWDVKHRVLMGRDTGGESNENATGDTGGFRWHGEDGPDEADNNHPDHKNHSHVMWAGSDTKQADDSGGGDIKVFDADQPVAGVWTTGVDELKPDTDGTDFSNHLGPFNANKDTDNRMPFKVGVLIERYK